MARRPLDPHELLQAVAEDLGGALTQIKNAQAYHMEPDEFAHALEAIRVHLRNLEAYISQAKVELSQAVTVIETLSRNAQTSQMQATTTLDAVLTSIGRIAQQLEEAVRWGNQQQRASTQGSVPRRAQRLR